MVDWLLQNSLGPMWLAMCKKHGWTPEVEADGTLARLEERRVEWRAKREAGEVSLTELMPLDTDAERRWAYYVPQPIPDDAVEHAPESSPRPAGSRPGGRLGALPGRGLRPAGGPLPRGGAAPGRGRPGALVRPRDRRAHPGAQPPRHRPRPAGGADRGGGPLAEGPAGLPRRPARAAQPRRLEPAPRRACADDDPALVELRREVERETGIPAQLTDTLVHALRAPITWVACSRSTRRSMRLSARTRQRWAGRSTEQGDSFGGMPPEPSSDRARPRRGSRTCSIGWRGSSPRHTGGDDLGLRLAASNSRRACASCG